MCNVARSLSLVTAVGARSEQEAHRLEPGTRVLLWHLRAHVDGQQGTVAQMWWRGQQLMADVVIAPLPPGHPEQDTPVRLRRSGFMPFTVTAPAAAVRKIV